jgi:hypothetical protein
MGDWVSHLEFIRIDETHTDICILIGGCGS